MYLCTVLYPNLEYLMAKRTELKTLKQWHNVDSDNTEEEGIMEIAKEKNIMTKKKESRVKE